MIEKKFFDICSRLLPVEGYGVYDIRYLSGSATLGVFITKSENVKGVDINDCIKVDRILSPFIEDEEWVPENFMLEYLQGYIETSSADQLKYSVGELIEVKFNSLIEDKKLKNKSIVVTLVKFDECSMTVITEDSKEESLIKYELIKSVNAELKI